MHHHWERGCAALISKLSRPPTSKPRSQEDIPKTPSVPKGTVADIGLSHDYYKDTRLPHRHTTTIQTRNYYRDTK